jgi:hypothetical protein
MHSPRGDGATGEGESRGRGTGCREHRYLHGSKCLVLPGQGLGRGPNQRGKQGYLPPGLTPTTTAYLVAEAREGITDCYPQLSEDWGGYPPFLLGRDVFGR